MTKWSILCLYDGSVTLPFVEFDSACLYPILDEES